MENRESKYQLIYRVIRRIPLGRVATYGQVARLAGLPRHARLVGYALHNLQPDSDVPWQRVINRKGMISLGERCFGAERQKMILEEEGVEFGPGDRIDLEEFGWRPGEDEFF